MRSGDSESVRRPREHSLIGGGASSIPFASLFHDGISHSGNTSLWERVGGIGMREQKTPACRSYVPLIRPVRPPSPRWSVELQRKSTAGRRADGGRRERLNHHLWRMRPASWGFAPDVAPTPATLCWRAGMRFPKAGTTHLPRRGSATAPCAIRANCTVSRCGLALIIPKRLDIFRYAGGLAAHEFCQVLQRFL